MNHRWAGLAGALLLLVMQVASGAVRPPARKSDRKALGFITRSVQKLAKADRFAMKMNARYIEDKNNVSGHLTLVLEKKPLRAATRADFHAAFQGMNLDFKGEGRYLGNVVYFIVNESPFGKPEFIGHWFEMNFNQAGKLLTPEALSKMQSPGTRAGEKVSVKALGQGLEKLDIREKRDETVAGVPCRRIVASVSPATLVQLYLSALPKAIPFPAASLQPFAKKLAGAPPVSADFWIGKKDGRLYRVFVPMGKAGGLTLDVDYHETPPSGSFTPPDDAADARALGFYSAGLLPPEIRSAVFPEGIQAEPKEVKPIPGTVIYLLPLSPYKGPSVENLKAFLVKEFDLENVEILPPVPIPDKTFNDIRLQYAGEDLLNAALVAFKDQQLDAPDHYLIAVTDQDMYSSRDPRYVFVSTLSQGSDGIVSFNRLKAQDQDQMTARADKLLARTLGFVYWKLPETTLPQDLMYEKLYQIPEDLDRMGLQFLVDKAGGLVKQGMSETDPATAREDFANALHYDPMSAKIYELLGKADYALGRYDEASVAFNKAILLSPSRDEAYYFLGLTDEKLGDSSAAASEYLGAIFLNPNREDAYRRLGAIYRARGENDKADAMTKKADALAHPSNY